MNKKGFTFVELAIVLVIIGLVMGMVIKGKDLIKTAKMRKEVNKLRTLETALFTYYTMTFRVPAPDYKDTGYDSVKPDSFIRLGLAKESDFHSDYLEGTGTTRGGNWKIMYIQRDHANDASDAGKALRDTVAFSGRHAYESLVCYIEVMMDDMNTKTGGGYIRHSTVADSWTVADYGSCDTKSDKSATIAGHHYVYYPWW